MFPISECVIIYNDLLVYRPVMYVTVSFLSPLSFFCKENYAYDIAMSVLSYVNA
jgi:hypothetical protein